MYGQRMFLLNTCPGRFTGAEKTSVLTKYNVAFLLRGLLGMDFSLFLFFFWYFFNSLDLFLKIVLTVPINRWPESFDTKTCQGIFYL